MNDKEIDKLLTSSAVIKDEEVKSLGVTDSLHELGEEIIATGDGKGTDSTSAKPKRFAFAASIGVIAIVLAILIPTTLSSQTAGTSPLGADGADQQPPLQSTPENKPPKPDETETKTETTTANPTQKVFTQSNGDGETHPWDGKTTFKVENHTKSAHADTEIYWAIIGRNPASGNFVHIEADGSAKEVSLSDNGALTKDGQDYTNYFHNLSELDTVTIDTIDSARLLMSVGSPMFIQINTDVNGKLGYAGANVENPDDPNRDIYFDFAEMAIVDDLGIFINTTRVDHFGFPLRLRLEGKGGYDRTVGETKTRSELVDAFNTEVPAEFQSLNTSPDDPYRIMAPAHESFKVGEENGDYLDAYIDEVWNKYRTEDLTFTIQSGTYTGHVEGDSFTFTDKKTGTGKYMINGKPSTEMVMLGNGLLDDPTGAAGPDAVSVQLQIQAQMTAALNRRVAHTPAEWTNHESYHPEGLRSNSYAAFWHRHSIDNLAYGFSYDDVAEYSPSLHTGSPSTVTIEIGW